MMLPPELGGALRILKNKLLSPLSLMSELFWERIEVGNLVVGMLLRRWICDCVFHGGGLALETYASVSFQQYPNGESQECG